MKKGNHLLLVDDDADFRISASMALKQAGYEVGEAGNGMEALEKRLDAWSRGERFPLLVTDIIISPVNTNPVNTNREMVGRNFR